MATSGWPRMVFDEALAARTGRVAPGVARTKVKLIPAVQSRMSSVGTREPSEPPLQRMPAERRIGLFANHA